MLQVYLSGRLFGARFGEGPVRVVALHGWGRSHRDYEPAFGRGIVDEGLAPIPASVVAVDLPGFGASPPPVEPWSTAGYGQLIADLIEEVATDSVVVVGHSFGGRVAARLAASRGDLVAGLVLAGVPLRLAGAGAGRPVRRPAVRFRVARSLSRWGLVSEGTMERARRRYGSADYGAASGVMREVLVRTVQEVYDDDLARIACPVEIVWGENDTEVGVESARLLAGVLKRSRLRVVPGAGHLIPTEVPGALLGTTVEVLEEAGIGRCH